MLSAFWSQYGSVLIWLYSASTSVLVIVVSSMIFMEKRNPSKTLAWLAILNILPFLGLIFYVIFGQNLRKRKKVKTKYINELENLKQMVDRQIDTLMNGQEIINGLPPMKPRLMQLLLRNATSPFTKSNCTTILSEGQDTFDLIFEEIEKAEHHVHLEYYIIKDDVLGRKFKELLIKKAKQGVKVRLLYDDVGCWQLPRSYTSELLQNGVELKPFLPVVLPFVNNRLNYRNHRKIVIVDGKTGFIGGLNVGDEYLGHHPKLGKWRDTHLMIKGTATHFLQVIFLLDWEFVTENELTDQVYFPELPDFNGNMIQIAASGPDSDWETVHQSYFTMITSAQKSIKIATPYLIPDDAILLALKTAALSGVDVQIIVPGKPDKKFVKWASQSYYEELMDAGVKIYLYEPGFIHSKMISVDGEVASLGTANLDIRSFSLNFEVNAILYDRELVQKIDEIFLNDLHESIQIDYQDFANRPLAVKISQSAARLLSPLL